ncbi:MAG: hypothetical protein Q4C53_08025 [Clostridia bacterium]|nr:hypothetical protein [Clostridia bacterium]
MKYELRMDKSYELTVVAPEETEGTLVTIEEEPVPLAPTPTGVVTVPHWVLHAVLFAATAAVVVAAVMFSKNMKHKLAVLAGKGGAAK